MHVSIKITQSPMVP